MLIAISDPHFQEVYRRLLEFDDLRPETEISGFPTVEFLKNNRRGESFFFDLGTWRQQIRRCVDGTTYAKVKALTYAVFYRKDEDNLAGPDKRYSFDYWSGMTKRELQR